MSDEPMTPLAESAAATHEYFTSLRDSGFTRREALEIVIAALVAGIKGNQL